MSKRTTIWKFPLRPNEQVALPANHKLLSVGVQQGKPFLWAEVDPESVETTRTLIPVSTGGPLPPRGRFLGTVVGIDQWMVFHFYEEPTIHEEA